MEINKVPPEHVGMLSELRLKNDDCFEYAKELILLEIEFHNDRVDSSERRSRIQTIKNERAPKTFANDPESLDLVTQACESLLLVD